MGLPGQAIGRGTGGVSIAGDRVRRGVDRGTRKKEGSMRYLLLICGDEAMRLSPEESDRMRRDTLAWVEEMDGRGIRLRGEPLRPVSDATTVRIRDGKLLVSDGPFAETKEQVGGYDVLECASLEQAVEVAAKHPVARIGTLEARPFWED